jgi:lipopolysaccharide transport system permease protein
MAMVTVTAMAMAMATVTAIIKRKMNNKDANWDIVIKPANTGFKIDFKSLWLYRDLIRMFVVRDFIAVYKQTVLGPIWHLVQPILTTLTFVFIFGNVAGISTDGLPHILFYMSGIILWGYFSEGLKKTSNIFIVNSHLFGKVYFPRLVMPISIIISSLISFFVQFILFMIFWFYYYFFTDTPPFLGWQIILFPVLIFIMALLGLGFGIFVSSLTTKYRDLGFLVGFGTQLLMYLSPVIYPLSTVGGSLKFVILANPMTPIIETFRTGFLGTGTFNWYYLGYSFVFAIFIFISSIFIFNKVEKNFTDTI